MELDTSFDVAERDHKPRKLGKKGRAFLAALAIYDANIEGAGSDAMGRMYEDHREQFIANHPRQAYLAGN